MTKQKIKPKDFMFIKLFKEKFGVKFVDDKGNEIEFEPTNQKEEQ